MTGVSRREVCGVVLAGGDSTRFDDTDKALAQFAGKPLVSHVTSVLHAATGQSPILAARTDSRATMFSDVLPELPSVPDDPEFEGPIAGLFAAAETASTPWILVTACDMPLISRPAVESLIKYATPSADAVVPVDDSGYPEPLFALYRTESVRRKRPSIPVAAGPQLLLDELNAVRTLRIDSHPPLGRAVTNVNTRGELQNLDTVATSNDPVE